MSLNWAWRTNERITFLRNNFHPMCCCCSITLCYFFFKLLLLSCYSWFSLSIGDDILNRPRQICKFNTSISNGFDLCVVLLLLLRLDTHCLFYYYFFVFVLLSCSTYNSLWSFFYWTILFVFSFYLIAGAHLYSLNA